MGWPAAGGVGMRCGNAAGGQSGRPLGAWTVDTPAAGHVGIGRPTLHGRPCYVPLGQHLVYIYVLGIKNYMISDVCSVLEQPVLLLVLMKTMTSLLHIPAATGLSMSFDMQLFSVLIKFV